ncbi:hypothetical protein DKT68_30725 [Micromonospora acroterricola]|uniref:Gram-positive cocci surface proteins LPxTG domain-containing protein n=1 Tax=Micromonospora acroterricola TaxID=2202421 RepID=A0A317CR56_9ACTN|nr:hypothetical protein DKT68_30725 [Micromonospora acroterricola]
MLGQWPDERRGLRDPADAHRRGRRHGQLRRTGDGHRGHEDRAALARPGEPVHQQGHLADASPGGRWIRRRGRHHSAAAGRPDRRAGHAHPRAAELPRTGTAGTTYGLVGAALLTVGVGLLLLRRRFRRS